MLDSELRCSYAPKGKGRLAHNKNNNSGPIQPMLKDYQDVTQRKEEEEIVCNRW
jgi:hypothetical protein